MKSFTGKFVLKFTAKVRSQADLERRCEKIAARAERTIGRELWDFEQLVELPTVIPWVTTRCSSARSAILTKDRMHRRPNPSGRSSKR
jgi:hypothetical protein